VDSFEVLDENDPHLIGAPQECLRYCGQSLEAAKKKELPLRARKAASPGLWALDKV